jgi:hypothetical protein
MVGEDDNIVALYERNAMVFDEFRGRTLFEQPWLDRFTRWCRRAAIFSTSAAVAPSRSHRA